MTDANLRSIRDFAHKKTIKQVLQPMIEQAWGGDVPGGCAAFFSQFFRATVFLCRFFSIYRCLFWVDFTNICIFFAVYYVYFIKKSNSVLGTKFS